MRTVVSFAVIGSILLVGCADPLNNKSATAVGPSSVEAPATAGPDRVRAQRVDEDGGAGGGTCGEAGCGSIRVTSGDASLEGLISPHEISLGGDLRSFNLSTDIGAVEGIYGHSEVPSPGGHFEGGSIELAVSSGTARVTLSLT